ATAEFLMPRVKIIGSSSLDEIRDRFGVSQQAAKIRFSEVVASSKPRELPASGKTYLEQRKPPPTRERAVRPPPPPLTRLSENDLLWEHAPTVAGQSPSEYRASRKGFPVKRQDYLKTTEFGWFVHNGEIFAHRETIAATQEDSELCPDCGNLSWQRAGLDR